MSNTSDLKTNFKNNIIYIPKKKERKMNREGGSDPSPAIPQREGGLHPQLPPFERVKGSLFYIMKR
jgi:hypothetical protein